MRREGNGERGRLKKKWRKFIGKVMRVMSDVDVCKEMFQIPK